MASLVMLWNMYRQASLRTQRRRRIQQQGLRVEVARGSDADTAESGYMTNDDDNYDDELSGRFALRAATWEHHDAAVTSVLESVLSRRGSNRTDFERGCLPLQTPPADDSGDGATNAAVIVGAPSLGPSLGRNCAYNYQRRSVNYGNDDDDTDTVAAVAISTCSNNANERVGACYDHADHYPRFVLPSNEDEAVLRWIELSRRAAPASVADVAIMPGDHRHAARTTTWAGLSPWWQSRNERGY